MKTIILFLGLSLSIISPVTSAPSAAETPEARQGESTALSFIEAFKAADVEKMQKSFAPEIQFLGEYRLIQLEEPMSEPVQVTAKEMADSYSKFFAKIGEERWAKYSGKFEVKV